MDTKAKNKKPSAIQPGMILSLVLGAGVAYALPENESFFAVFLFGLAGLCVSFALQTILHETGHLIGGLLTGYKFCSFRIGNFQLQRENGALRFRRLKLAGTGGQCLMTPPEPVDGNIPVMLYNLAGPLMNLLTALLALGGYFLSGGSMGASLLFLFALYLRSRGFISRSRTASRSGSGRSTTTAKTPSPCAAIRRPCAPFICKWP